MKILFLKGIKILDSRGEETLKVVMKTDRGGWSSVSLPQGKSKGKKEVISLKVNESLKRIKEIFSFLANKKISSQEQLDRLLLKLDGTENKRNLGGNTILGISLSLAKNFAQSRKQELYQYLKELIDKKEKISFNLKLLFNLINGGLHSPSGPSIQEYLLLTNLDKGRGIWLASKIYHSLGKKLKAGLGDEGGFILRERDNELPLRLLKQIVKKINSSQKIRFGLDVAASNIKEKINILKLVEKYNLLYLEDPKKENNFAGFRKLREELKSQGKDTLVVGDDLTATNPQRIKRAIREKSIDGIIVKPNQIGSLTEAIEAIKIAKKNKLKVIISHRSGETCDNFIADLALASNAWGLKSGAPSRSERNSKYNRLLEILNLRNGPMV